MQYYEDNMEKKTDIEEDRSNNLCAKSISNRLSSKGYRSVERPTELQRHRQFLGPNRCIFVPVIAVAYSLQQKATN